MITDTTEKGLETLFMLHMTGTDDLSAVPNVVAERPPPYGGTGHTAGGAHDVDRAHPIGGMRGGSGSVRGGRHPWGM